MKVLISDNLSARGVEILKKAGLQVDVKTGLSPEELKKEIEPYEALIVRSATKVTPAIIDSARNLRVIGRAGSGLDNVDRVAATKRGIVVMNTPGGNTITTAEHTFSLLLSMARKIPQATASMRQGKWEKKKFTGVELYNKVLGIIGLGNIGAHVAKMAIGAGMNIITYDPFLKEEKAKALGVKVVGIEDLIRNADVITVHTPLTDETRGLINAETIAKMKDGVMLINCARGGIIDERALCDALKSGKVAAAALDVFEKEPPADCQLLALDNVVATPHLGAATQEAQDNVAIAIAEQVVDYLVHGTIRNAVNFPSVSADVLHVINPYVNLAERIGGFLTQNFDEAIEQVVIEYKGSISELMLEPIKIAVLKGILTPILEETVNFINAPLIAQERGIEITETTAQDAGDYQGMLVVSIMSRKKTGKAAGVLHGKKDPRIVSSDGYSVEIVPEGDMLVVHNMDKPGVIGNIGALLGKNNINIARMQFGREKPGGRAVTVVSVDTTVSKEILSEIRKLPNIVSVKQIHLPA